MSTFKITATVAILVLLLSAIIYGIYVWRRREEYTRERFAFTALATITSLTTALLGLLEEKSMPWDFLARLFGHSNQKHELTGTDYSFLALVYGLSIYAVLQLHRNWSGAKSVHQYRREQRNESLSLLLEGLLELRRISKNDPPFEQHTRASTKPAVRQLEPITESLSWRDQVRELVKLSSSSYIIDAELGWHDKEGLWVGSNLDTDELIFVYPAAEQISDGKMAELNSYANFIASHKAKQRGEFIVAFKSGVPLLQQAPKGIRFETETSLLDKLINITDYRNEIRKRVEKSCLPDSTLTIKDVYVPSQYETTEHTQKDIHQFLQSWLLDKSQRQIAMLGGYGQGKSTTALMFAHTLLTGRNDSDRIPIVIELRGTSPRNLTPLQLLGAWSAQFNINPQALLRLHIAGRLILIFEGFDEMALVGDMEMRLKHFRTLWQFCYPNAKIIITGRPNFFLDEEELKAALGISKLSVDRPYCEAVTLAPFGIRQIEKALMAHPPLVRQQICSFVRQNERFREVVSRPSLLHIVSLLWEQERLSDDIDKLNSAYIMGSFVRHSYSRQGLKETDSPGFMALTTLEREFFMRGVATYMAAKRLPNQISGMQLNDLIESLIEAIPEAISAGTATMLNEVTTTLRTRLETAEHGLEHVKTDVRACGLLVDDPAAPGTFRFGHKSFMEYLFAVVLADNVQNQNIESARALLKVTGANIADVLSLPVSIDFLAELLSPENAFTDEGLVRPISEPEELVTARKLLDAVLHGSLLRRSITKLALFYDVSDRSWRRYIIKWPSPWKYIAVFPVFSFLILSIYFLSRFGILPRRLEHLPGFYVLPALVLLPKLISQSFPDKRRWVLWNRLCRGIGIDNHTMHRAISTSLLPWTKHQRFDYYFDDEIITKIK